MFRNAVRWIGPALLVAVVLAVGNEGLDRSTPPPLQRAAAPVLLPGEQAMRQAFEEASAGCYSNFSGAELRGCLAGVMQAHLEALETHQQQAGMRATVRNDI
jgi:hypothetical protein